MELPDEDTETLDRFSAWLYTTKYQLAGFNTEEEAHERFNALAKLNTFADKFNIGTLMNNIIDRMWEPWTLFSKGSLPSKCLFCPRVSLVAYVYENTTLESHFRKLMVAWYAWEIGLSWYDHPDTRDALADIGQDFAVDLAMALGQRLAFRDRTSPFRWPKEVFYVDITETTTQVDGVVMTLPKED
ncbi:hypothetical protein P7C71_g4376, partial [Lecanoromycetidae sp. Uapishka_2]